MNDPVIVYCKAGSRSQIACQILVSHSFAKSTTCLADNRLDRSRLSHIHNLSLCCSQCFGRRNPVVNRPPTITSDGCMSCAQNQTCQNINAPSNIPVTTIEQNENATITLITYEVNDTPYEVTVTQTLLWSYNELTDEINRTANFVSAEIATEETSVQFYSLSYIVQMKNTT